MKIVIANRRYFESYGPERYLFQITEQLEKNGHQVIPFSVRRKWNKETPYVNYFVSPPAGEDVLYYKDYKINYFQKLRIFANAIYSLEAKKRMGKLISEQGAELVYLLGIVNDISPSIIDAVKKYGIPVVLRASDFYLFCPQYLFMRNRKVCRECEHFGYKRALRYKCVKNSLGATSARVASMYIHKWLNIYDKVDAIVAPSRYMRDAFLKAGFHIDRVHYIPSFFDSHDIQPCYENDRYILYFGRVDEDKGVINLIKAYEMGMFEVPLLIVGTSGDNEDKRLMEYVHRKKISNINFLGFKKRGELIPLIQRSMFTVVPSIWPDNSPMSVLEAMSCGKPVIGSNLGGIAEQITSECGILVPPNDPASLASAIYTLLSDSQKIVDMGKRGSQRVREEYSIQRHYDRVISLFNQLTESRALVKKHVNIAIVNRRYFESYGPERYLFQISEQIEKKNAYRVFPFSVKRKWNKETPYSEYFVLPPAGEDVLYFKDYKPNLYQKIKILANAIYSLEAKKKIERLIMDKDIDLLYLLSIANDISPSIIDVAKRHGIPIVLRVSDGYLFCPNYIFFRNRQVCRECEYHGYKRAMKYRCVQGSLAATGARVISMYIHKWLKIYDKVDAFVTPSLFMKNVFLEAGFPEEKIYHINSFFNSDDSQPRYDNDGYILYFGRIDANKGVINLIKSYEVGRLEVPLIIAGTAADGEDERLINYVQDKKIDNISFVGFKSRDELIPLIQGAILTVTPSICFDNSPMSVIESMACGKPVVGSDLGGISEQITPECGILVPPNDPIALATAISSLLADPQKVIDMGEKGFERVKLHYSLENHYKRLISIFQQLINC